MTIKEMQKEPLLKIIIVLIKDFFLKSFIYYYSI